MAQMKEQIKTPVKELNKMEISNLSDPETKTLVIRLLKVEDLNSIEKDPFRNEGFTNYINKIFKGKQQYSGRS